MIASELKELLVCPKCKGRLDAPEEREALHCSRCKLAFPIREGIPVMLLDEAQPIA